MELFYIALIGLIVFGPSFILAAYYEHTYKLGGKAYMIAFWVLAIVWLVVTFVTAKSKKGRRSHV